MQGQKMNEDVFNVHNRIVRAVQTDNLAELQEVMDACKDRMDTQGLYPSDILLVIKTNLLVAAQQGYAGVAEYLFQYAVSLGEDPKTSNALNTPLMLAAESGGTQAVHLLLDIGCSVNWVDINTRSSLHWAALGGHNDAVALLLDRGALVNLQDTTYGFSSFMLACRQGHAEVAQILMDNGCDPNLCDKDGETALFESVRNNRRRCVQMLINYGVNINQKDHMGRTPLLVAVLWNRPNMVRELIYANCDMEVPAVTRYTSYYRKAHLHNFDKFTPFQAALKECRLSIAEILAKAGCCLKGCQEILVKEDVVEDEKFSSLIMELTQPRTLRVLCRKVIRQKLGAGIHSKLQFLPIPQTVRDYITIPELICTQGQQA